MMEAIGGAVAHAHAEIARQLTSQQPVYHTYVTDNNKTPLIQVMTWFLLTSTIFGVLCRALTKAGVVHVLGPDDHLVSVALVFAVGQFSAVTVQTVDGLGKALADLSGVKIDRIMKAELAAEVVYVISLCFAKLSVLSLLHTISVNQRFSNVLLAAAAFILTWTTSSFLVIVFQCHMPVVYDVVSNTCVDRVAFWTSYEILNLLTDALLISLPIALVWPVQTSLSNKVSVCCYFGVRTWAIAAIICKLVYLKNPFGGLDPILDNWPLTICTECILCLSIIATCVLYVRPFLEALSSGFLNVDDLRRRGVMTPYTLESSDVKSTMALANPTSRGVFAGDPSPKTTTEIRGGSRRVFSSDSDEPLVEIPGGNEKQDQGEPYLGDIQAKRTFKVERKPPSSPAQASE